MTEKFELTENHIKLAQRMYIGWSDECYGAPEIDPKRPYGNSDVEEDICEILGKTKLEVNYEEEYTTKDLQEASVIHREMEIALQIILYFKTFEPGKFIRENSWEDWTKLEGVEQQ